MFARILLLLAPIASLGCGINNNCGPLNPFGCAKDDGADGFGTTAAGQTTSAPTTSTSTSTSTTDTSTVDPTLSSIPSTTEGSTSSTDAMTTMADPTTGTATTMNSTGTSEVTTDSSTTMVDDKCGDGFTDPGEECDDGNLENFDECSNACTIVVHRKVFVSSMAWTATLGGKLGGLKGADEKCAAAAKMANLEGTFISWLSTDDLSNAAGRLGMDFTGVYDLVKGPRVAVGWVGLTEKPLENAINRDENGTVTDGQAVWTNTRPDGTSAGTGHCDNWTSNASNAAYKPFVGNSSSTDSTWTQMDLQGCGTDRRLYCFQVGP
jgi:cysteine-rich repeat protein